MSGRDTPPVIGEIRRRLALLTRAERLQWLSFLPLSLAAAILELLSGIVVFALLAELTGQGSVISGTPADTVTSRLSALGLPATPMALTMVMATLYVVKNGLLLAAVYYRARVGGRFAGGLSGRVVRAYLAAPYTFHLRRNSAGVAQNVLLGIPAVVRLLDAVVTLVTEVLAVVGLTLLLMQVALVETLAAVAIVGAIVGLFVRAARGRYHQLGARHYELSARMLQQLQHAFGAIKEVKVFGRERHFGGVLSRVEEARTRVFVNHAALEAVPRLLTETAFVLGLVGLVLALQLRVGATAALLPFIGLYAYAGLRLIPAGHRLSLQTGNVRYELAASESMCRDMEALAAIDADARRAPAGDGIQFRSQVRLEDVSYAYERDAPILQGIGLTVARGECVAIVGATGAGKTTLVDLVLGILEPTTGRLMVDDVPLAGRLESWRRHIGYVPQDPFLVDDTLRRNIAFGLADTEIDDTAVHAAIRIAQLERFVAGLPLGLDTPIGERGVRLSGGERQRVSIARALYRGPDLLVFDEATSSLDPATERALTDAIERLKGDKTLLVVAHRLSTVQRADRLVLLRGGRIAAIGSYDELAQSNDEFRELAALAGR